MADSNGVLNLNVVNVYQEDVAEQVTVIVKNQQLADNRFFPNMPGGNTIQLQGLMRTPQGRYLLEVDSPSYRPVSQFINIPASGDQTIDVVLPVNPNRVTSMARPAVKDQRRRHLRVGTRQPDDGQRKLARNGRQRNALRHETPGHPVGQRGRRQELGSLEDRREPGQ